MDEWGHCETLVMEMTEVYDRNKWWCVFVLDQSSNVQHFIFEFSLYFAPPKLMYEVFDKVITLNHKFIFKILTHEEPKANG